MKWYKPATQLATDCNVASWMKLELRESTG